MSPSQTYSHQVCVDRPGRDLMSDASEAVVIGAGHNGLVVAVLLAPASTPADDDGLASQAVGWRMRTTPALEEHPVRESSGRRDRPSEESEVQWQSSSHR